MHLTTEKWRTEEMKKLLSLLALILVCVLAMTMGASAQVNADVKVSAIAEVYTYHQIKAFVLEYPTEIAEPEEGTYTIVDFAPAHMKEDYDQRPYAEAVITAVYTNDAPEMREDKTSVPGKYVIIEQELVNGSFFDEKDEIWKPNNLCGLATWRNAGERSEHFRENYNELIISRTKNVVTSAGETVVASGILPTLQKADVHTLVLDDFNITTLPSYNGKYDIHYSIHIPADYDASVKYPVVFCCHGGGGYLQYKIQLAEDGITPTTVAGDLGRDAVAVAFARDASVPAIVIAHQRLLGAPEEWEVNDVEDEITLIDYLDKNYSIDRDRIVQIGSSAGTHFTAEFITAHPDVLAGFMMCNGDFLGANIFKPEYRSRGGEAITTSTDAMAFNLIHPDCFVSEEEYAAEKAKFKDVVENRLPIYIWHAVNDENATWTHAVSTYRLLCESYQEAGLSYDEIQQLVLFHFADNPEYYNYGICEMHATSKLAVDYTWAIDWLLSQHK